MTSAKFNVCALRNSTQAMASSRIYNTAGQSCFFPLWTFLYKNPIHSSSLLFSFSSPTPRLDAVRTIQ